ncbi:MAG: hypothetical protein FWH48_02805, partial [Oscillospiraceae bacterium]|nr:hypothetical protein [Oscillospiraceae bacterium]
MKNINREDKNAKGFHTWQSDKARTGLCDVKGSITNPSISFEMDISSKRHIFEYAGAIGQNSAIPKNIEADGKFVADITAPGEGKTDTTHQRTGYFLPGAKELQKVECDTYFGNLNIDDLRVRFYIFDSQKNDWELKWESEHIHMLCLSLPIIADIDDDGKIELAVFPWYDVVVFDLETGTQKYRSSFHNEKVKHGRAYGWVGAYDALHDGRKEIFIIPNHNHMAMMGWEGDELKLKWSHFFEEDCAVMKTAYNIPEHAVMDIDGDGELEILTSIYNWHDDNRWHIYVLNAATGDIILDIPDRYLYDNIDAEKTGNWLTASMKTSGRRINKYGDLNFMKFYRENGKLIFKDIWEQKKSEFSSRAKVVRDDHMNNMMFTATDPIRFAKIGEDKYAFATTFYRDVSKIDTTLTLWSIESGEIKKISKIEGKRLKMLGNINTPPHISSDAAFNENEAESSGLICDSCKLEYIGSSHIRPILGGASVGQFCPGKPLAIFAEDALDNMVAFTLSEKKGETELCLATPGRAMFYGSTTLSGYYLMGAGYELCDIDGDGYVEVLSAWGAES